MKRVVIAAAGLGAVVVAALAIWLVFVRDDAPPAFELSEAAPDTTDPSSSQDGSGTTDTTAATVSSLDGTWLVGQGSEAGYRVVEDLGEIIDFEAVGRTTDVTGSIEIDGTSVDAATFEVDVATISSDDGRRDGAFAGPIMNATEFPTASFVLTAPIDFGTVPSEGVPVSASATGDLTLRGATNPVTFPVDAQLIDGMIELVGSIDVLFSEYGIDNPSNSLVSVRDEGKVEVLLVLNPS